MHQASASHPPKSSSPQWRGTTARLARQPLVAAAYLEPLGAAWVSPLFGQPGFVRAIGRRALLVASEPTFGDPLFSALRDGMAIAILGLDFASERLSLVSGRAYVRQRGFVVRHGIAHRIDASSLPVRRWRLLPGIEAAGRLRQPAPLVDLADHARLLATADVCFVAFDAQGSLQPIAGRPGFASFDGANSLTLAGNTARGIVNGPAGLLFVDFATGDVLQLSGRTHRDRRDSDKRTFAIETGQFTAAAIPIAWVEARFISDTRPEPQTQRNNA